MEAQERTSEWDDQKDWSEWKGFNHTNLTAVTQNHQTTDDEDQHELKNKERQRHILIHHCLIFLCCQISAKKFSQTL